MIDAMHKTSFKGDLPAFLHYLRTDPKFYAKTPDELLMRRGLDRQEGRTGRSGQYFG